MLREVVLTLLAAGCWLLGFGWFLMRLLKPARAIWHGDTSPMKRWWRFTIRYVLEVTPRSYFAFLLTMVPVTVAIMLFPLCAIGLQVTRSNPWLILDLFPLMCICVAYCGIVLHALVNAFNRPRWLVAPPYRHQPGWVAQRRVRRKNGRSRQPSRTTS